MRGINHPRYDTYCMVAPILYGRLYFDLQKIGNAPGNRRVILREERPKNPDFEIPNHEHSNDCSIFNQRPLVYSRNDHDDDGAYIVSYGYNEVTPYLFLGGIAVFFLVAVFLAIKAALFYREFFTEYLSPENSHYLFSLPGVIGLAGICCSKLSGNHIIYWIFWYLSIALWVSVTLSSFSFLFLCRKPEDRKLEEVLHGGWFFVSVGTQITALMGTVVAKQATEHLFLIHLVSFGLWSVGAFYIFYL